MRRLGAEEPSFPSIVAAGAHGALPHAQPRDVEIPRDVLVTIDWGARSTATARTAPAPTRPARGSPRGRARSTSWCARRSWPASRPCERARTGARSTRAAREVIDAGGEGATSATGSATASAWRSTRRRGSRAQRPEEPLLAGSVVTVEPGVYLPDELGVRIEDLAVVRGAGCDMLTTLPKELTVVS